MPEHGMWGEMAEYQQESKYSWNQPICEECWPFWNFWVLGRTAPDPTSLKEPVQEKCGWCGVQTRWGVYVRHDPAHTPYPAKREEDQ